MRTRVWIMSAALLACASLAAAQVVFGGGNRQKQEKQDPTIRNVEGVVTGPDDKPVPRAIVQLKDMKTLQVRSFVAGAEGDYRFTGLSREIDYEVKATFEGMESDTKRLTVFNSQANPRVNLKLAAKAEKK